MNDRSALDLSVVETNLLANGRGVFPGLCAGDDIRCQSRSGSKISCSKLVEKPGSWMHTRFVENEYKLRASAVNDA